MRIPATLKATALIGLAVLAGLLGVTGTWALWNDAEPSGAGTVQSAAFDIRLNGNPMAATATMVPETPGATVKPGTPVFATVTVRNTTTAGTPMSVTALMGAPAVVNPSTPGLGTALTARTALAPATGGCAQADYPATNTGVSTVIAHGDTARFCVRVTLPQNAPATLAQHTATIAATVTVTQQPRGA